MVAGKDATMGAVTNTGGGDVRIFANQGSSPTSDPFQIGASKPANGVTSVINNYAPGAFQIYITNGSGTGGISYNGTSSTLQATAASGTAGIITLDGGTSNNITLNGTLSADNPTGAGTINLFANKIIANSATVTASSVICKSKHPHKNKVMRKIE
jgi:hypothetical protein